jgi:8-oxo-dGTP diphosphatase
MTKPVYAVGVIFENKQGQILVLRRHPQDPEGTTWGLAGGKVEAGEDEKTAAQREVQEEIGYSLDTSDLQSVKSYHWERQDLDIHFTVFVLPAQTKEVVLNINQVEHTEHLWALPQDLYQRKDLMQGLYPILKDRYDVS